MSWLALSLVLAAALTHATWNLLAKKAANVGAAFVAAYTGFATLIYAPAALWALLTFGFPISPSTIFCVLASGVLHLAYSLVLQRGYQVADLSIVYGGHDLRLLPAGTRRPSRSTARLARSGDDSG